MAGVATVGDTSVALIVSIIGAGRTIAAKLLEALLALIALAAGIDEAANTGEVADFKLSYIGTHFCNTSYDLVTGYHGIDGITPLIANLVEIRMTDTTIKYFKFHVIGTGVASFKAKRAEVICGTMCGISFCCSHDQLFFVKVLIIQAAAGDVFRE
jgi:hypothetical protein